MSAFLRRALLASFLAVATCLGAAVPQDFVVDLKATVAESEPRLVLNWTQRLQSNILSQAIHRRLKGETNWTLLADLTPTTTTYADTTALAGITSMFANTTGAGAVQTAVNTSSTLIGNLLNVLTAGKTSTSTSTSTTTVTAPITVTATNAVQTAETIANRLLALVS